MLQLLCQIETADPAAWQRAFDAGAEARAEAGLTLLQQWHAADSRGEILLLLQVSDRKRAQDWLDRAAGFGRPMTATFLRTA